MRPFRTRPPRSAAPPVSRAVSGVFAQLARQTKFIDPALAGQWPSLAGARIAELCRPGRITGRPPGRTLEVHAASSAAAAEIGLMTDTLITRVNGYFGPGFISRIAIRQTAARRPPAPAASAEGGADGLGAALSSFRAAVRRRDGGEPEDK